MYFKSVIALLALALLAISWWQHEMPQQAVTPLDKTARHARIDGVFAGQPRAVIDSPWHEIRVLGNQGFSIGYSDKRRNPLWVAYRSAPVRGRYDFPRPEGYEMDRRTAAAVEPRAFSGSGYQRGHMAPNYHISRLYGREAQLQTFLMSNISPQKPHLNQKLWQRLEEVEIDRFARRLGEIWVVTGPIFEGHRERLRSGVEVPDAFYRIILHEGGGGRLDVIAFIMPQDVKGTEPLDRYVVTVDEVETRTGLDFYHELADEFEDSLEASRPGSIWQLSKVSRLPPRY